MFCPSHTSYFLIDYLFYVFLYLNYFSNRDYSLAFNLISYTIISGRCTNTILLQSRFILKVMPICALPMVALFYIFIIKIFFDTNKVHTLIVFLNNDFYHLQIYPLFPSVIVSFMQIIGSSETRVERNSAPRPRPGLCACANEWSHVSISHSFTGHMDIQVNIHIFSYLCMAPHCYLEHTHVCFPFVVCRKVTALPTSSLHILFHIEAWDVD